MIDAPTSPLAALHLLVSMLGEGALAAPGASFYDRLAEAVCRLGLMRRAVVYLSDDLRRRVWAAGAFGIELAPLNEAGPVQPIGLALHALGQDRVIEVRGAAAVAAELPADVATRLGLADVTCIPMSAGGRHYGVVLAERGDAGAPPLSAAEREGLWTLGKVCALAASARAATRQQERARQLGDRLDLARDVHERVIQRLFGVTLALGAGDLTGDQRERCATELQQATEELRVAIQRPPARGSADREQGGGAAEGTLREELDRLAGEHADVRFAVAWPSGLEVPARLDGLAQTVVAEAVRNARKHATPTAIAITLEETGGALAVDVENDGVGAAAPVGAGVGLRLAAFEALEYGAAVDFGRVEPDRWHVRLVVPMPTT